MPISQGGTAGKYSERPAPCRACGAGAWWNGTRCVSALRKQGELVEHIVDIIRRRARCSWKLCSLSWTVYEEDSYPHRLFGLMVVASAVSSVVFGKATLTGAAEAHQCDRRSVGRWRRWISELADPGHLQRLCTRLQEDGCPGGLDLPEVARGGKVLHLLDRLAQLLTERGVELPKFGCGLVRVLKDQLLRFGEVFYLSRASPPLHADWGAIRL